MDGVNPVVRTSSLAFRPALRAEGARSWAHGSGVAHTLFFPSWFFTDFQEPFPLGAPLFFSSVLEEVDEGQ